EPTRVFKDIGFDSLAGIELRNRLATDTGLRLPATLAFDHPTPSALVGYLLGQVQSGGGGEAASLDAELVAVERRLSAIASQSDEAVRAEIAARLHKFLADWSGSEGVIADDRDVRGANVEEVFELIDREFGAPEQEESAHAHG
ncbi:MAG: phosphopantetheine-binding protein, partial [Solirubrobacteraceae bacterium]